MQICEAFEKILEENLYLDLARELGPYRIQVVLKSNPSLLKRKDGALNNISDELMISATHSIINKLNTIKTLVEEFFKDFSLKRNAECKVKIHELTVALETKIEDTLIQMFKASINSFKDIIKYLTLGLNFYEDSANRSNSNPTEQLDLYLSKSMYVLRRRAMKDFNHIPANLESSILPGKLPSARLPNFRRRVAYIRYLVYFLSRKACHGNKEIYSRYHERKENIIMVETIVDLVKNYQRSNLMLK